MGAVIVRVGIRPGGAAERIGLRALVLGDNIAAMAISRDVARTLVAVLLSAVLCTALAVDMDWDVVVPPGSSDGVSQQDLLEALYYPGFRVDRPVRSTPIPKCVRVPLS